MHGEVHERSTSNINWDNEENIGKSSGLKRQTSFQDLVEMYPFEYESGLKRPNIRQVHPTVLRSFCSTYAILFLFWIFVLITGEYLIYHYNISKCSFPELSKNSPDDIHIALIGDPQLTDKYSYKWVKKSGFLVTKIIEFYSDIYMRKNFQLLQLYHDPDVIFLMGDLFDSAKVLTDKEFEKEFHRYKWIFKSQNNIQQYTLSGNHDIGYDIDKNHQFSLAKRFSNYFGPINFDIIINGISFIFISATTLDENSSHYQLYKDTDSFIQSKKFDFSRNSSLILPRVLLHHIPLWRAPEMNCGSLRNRNEFLKDHSGYSYRNMLDQSITNQLLKIIKPFLTFSGDDHDYCKIKHSNTTTEVRFSFIFN